MPHSRKILNNFAELVASGNFGSTPFSVWVLIDDDDLWMVDPAAEPVINPNLMRFYDNPKSAKRGQAYYGRKGITKHLAFIEVGNTTTIDLVKE